MHRNRYIVFMETEIRSHEIVDELCRFVEFHAADVIAHTVQARALVAYYGPASTFGCLGQCCFELLYFFICYIGHAPLLFPISCRSKITHVFGKYDFVSGFLAKSYKYIGQRFGLVVLIACSHSAVDARGEVDEFAGLWFAALLVEMPG